MIRIARTSMLVDDVVAEHERLTVRGAIVGQPPPATGPVAGAILDDGRGNLIRSAGMK